MRSTFMYNDLTASVVNLFSQITLFLILIISFIRLNLARLCPLHRRYSAFIQILELLIPDTTHQLVKLFCRQVICLSLTITAALAHLVVTALFLHFLFLLLGSLYLLK
jgi:hypothetical protein